MKVKAVDEAKVHIRKRKAFRYNGCRGHKSKSCEGCYGVFWRNTMQPTGFRVTTLIAVYESRTAKWYSNTANLRMLHMMQLDLPEDVERHMTTPAPLLDSIYKGGYDVLVTARVMGEL